MQKVCFPSLNPRKTMWLFCPPPVTLGRDFPRLRGTFLPAFCLQCKPSGTTTTHKTVITMRTAGKAELSRAFWDILQDYLFPHNFTGIHFKSGFHLKNVQAGRKGSHIE